MTLYRVHPAENRRTYWEEERELPYEPNENITDPDGNARYITGLVGTRATAALGAYEEPTNAA